MAFTPGDVVTLKSGGHAMTVVSVTEEDIDCLWVGDDGELFRQSIPSVALTVAELTDLDEADEEEHDEEESDEDEEHEEDEDEEKEEDEDDEEREKRRKKR